MNLANRRLLFLASCWALLSLFGLALPRLVQGAFQTPWSWPRLNLHAPATQTQDLQSFEKLAYVTTPLQVLSTPAPEDLQSFEKLAYVTTPLQVLSTPAPEDLQSFEKLAYVTTPLQVLSTPAPKLIMAASQIRVTKTVTLTPQGGSLPLSATGFLSLTLPSNALTQTALLTYTKLLSAPHALHKNFAVLGIFALQAQTSTGESLTQTQKLYTLVLSYTDAEVRRLGVLEKDLQVLFWGGQAWQETMSQIDSEQKRVRVQTDRFTEGLLVGDKTKALRLNGPSLGRPNQPISFVATTNLSPTDQPFTYTWQATAQPTHIFTGLLKSTLSYVWETAGAKFLTVTAETPAGLFQNTTSLTLLQIFLRGPSAGRFTAAQKFEVWFTPTLQTPLAVTYTWQATDWPLRIKKESLTSTAVYTWNSWGPKTVRVTATLAQLDFKAQQTSLIRALAAQTTSDQITVSKTQGGELTQIGAQGNFVKVVIPLGAVPITTTLLYTPLLTPTYPLPQPQSSVLRSFFLETQPEGQAFTKESTVILSYTDEELAAKGFNELDLDLLSWNGKAWEPLPYTLDGLKNRLSFTIRSYGEFALVGPLALEKRNFLPLGFR